MVSRLKENQLKLPGLDYFCTSEFCKNVVDYLLLEEQKLMLCEKCFIEWSNRYYREGKTEEVFFDE